MIYNEWLLGTNLVIMASMAIDAFLIVVSAKQPLEEYRFAREMIKMGWAPQLMKISGVTTTVNFLALMIVMIV